MAIVFEGLVSEDLNLGTGTTTITNPGGGTLPGTQISVSTLSINGATSQATTASWNPGAISASQSVTTTVTYTGCVLGDFVLASFNKDLAGSTLSAYISSANTITCVLSNPTTATITPASGTLTLLVLRPR